MCTKRVAAAILTTVALILPAGAVAQADSPGDPTGLLASDNIEIHTVLPQPAAIGARFRGNFMYVTSTAGLTIYDISDPVSPSLVGALPLPHFENEDVDLGGNILLISNDAAESYGLLYVIDISDPAAPELLATHDMGGNPAGPVVDAADFLGVVPDQMNPGHTASCILECAFAWVTDAGGMRVIDLRDPTAPVRVGNFGTPAAGDLGITHDVQMDENSIAWISGYGGVAGYGIPADYADAVTAAAAPGGAGVNKYHESLLVANTDPSGHSRYGVTFGLDDGGTYNDYILHNSRRLKDSDVVYVTEEDYNRPGCEGAGSFETWRLPMREETDAEGNVTKVITGELMTPIDKW
ncbi:MAG: LVIVD repeat-containing protein, partial [Actinomycetota bacterium]